MIIKALGPSLFYPSWNRLKVLGVKKKIAKLVKHAKKLYKLAEGKTEK